MRRQKGSEVQIGEAFNKDPTEREEASMLYKADLEQMTSELAPLYFFSTFVLTDLEESYHKYPS